jgi:hypothetical protein
MEGQTAEGSKQLKTELESLKTSLVAHKEVLISFSGRTEKPKIKLRTESPTLKMTKCSSKSGILCHSEGSTWTNLRSWHMAWEWLCRIPQRFLLPRLLWTFRPYRVNSISLLRSPLMGRQYKVLSP